MKNLIWFADLAELFYTIQSPCYYNSNAVIQKHIVAISDNGVIMYFSFLLFDNKFVKTFVDKYAAKNRQIYFVVLIENHNEINPPACRIIIIANSCTTNEITAKILNFLGSILYCPPIMNSPKGNPQATKNVIPAIIIKSIIPVIANIFVTPYIILSIFAAFWLAAGWAWTYCPSASAEPGRWNHVPEKRNNSFLLHRPAVCRTNS